jgi:hypothetical protein
MCVQEDIEASMQGTYSFVGTREADERIWGLGTRASNLNVCARHLDCASAIIVELPWESYVELSCALIVRRVQSLN